MLCDPASASDLPDVEPTSVPEASVTLNAVPLPYLHKVNAISALPATLTSILSPL